MTTSKQNKDCNNLLIVLYLLVLEALIVHYKNLENIRDFWVKYF